MSYPFLRTKVIMINGFDEIYILISVSYSRKKLDQEVCHWREFWSVSALASSSVRCVGVSAEALA